MLISDPVILGNVLYAKEFQLLRRRGSDNPAPFKSHNLNPLERQSRPPFSIQNRAKMALPSLTLGGVTSLHPSNIRIRRPRNIERWCRLNLGKPAVSIVIYGYCPPTAIPASHYRLTNLTKKNEACEYPNCDIQISLAPLQERTPQ